VATYYQILWLLVLIAALGLSASAFVLWTRILPLDTLLVWLENNHQELWVGAVGLFFLAIGIHLIASVLKSWDKQEVTPVMETAYGPIEVTLDTIRAQTRDMLANIDGIRKIERIAFKLGTEGMEISLQLVVEANSKVPALTEEIQTTISDKMREKIGLEVSRVKVMIEDIRPG